MPSNHRIVKYTLENFLLASFQKKKSSALAQQHALIDTFWYGYVRPRSSSIGNIISLKGFLAKFSTDTTQRRKMEMAIDIIPVVCVLKHTEEGNLLNTFFAHCLSLSRGTANYSIIINNQLFSYGLSCVVIGTAHMCETFPSVIWARDVCLPTFGCEIDLNKFWCEKKYAVKRLPQC